MPISLCADLLTNSQPSSNLVGVERQCKRLLLPRPMLVPLSGWSGV